ncbi:hypothetical protein STEG23_016664 [Scotinomys teguina]
MDLDESVPVLQLWSSERTCCASCGYGYLCSKEILFPSTQVLEKSLKARDSKALEHFEGIAGRCHVCRCDRLPSNLCRILEKAIGIVFPKELEFPEESGGITCLMQILQNPDNLPDYGIRKKLEQRRCEVKKTLEP